MLKIYVDCRLIVISIDNVVMLLNEWEGKFVNVRRFLISSN